jgi:hypothetical protein
VLPSLIVQVSYFRLNLLNRTDAAAAAVTLSTCGTVLLLLITAQSSSSTTSASRNLPFKLCERALELLRDVDAKSIMPLHVHAQVMLLDIGIRWPCFHWTCDDHATQMCLLESLSTRLFCCLIVLQLAAAAHGVMSEKYLSRGLTSAGRREAEKALGAIR